MAELLHLDDPKVTVALRRSAQAKRLTLTVPQNGDAPRVTAPPGVSLADIRMFLMRQSDWLSAAIDRAPDAIIVSPGAVIPVEGRMLRIVHQSGPRRPPVINEGELVLSGAAASAKTVQVWLRERARAEVTAIATDCATKLGAKVGRVTMRDTKGQWGACTGRGDLSFSWRLAMAPPSVLDYVAAHEAAHLLEMNHGPKFWALVERLRPHWRNERNWLRQHGGGLHRYRFSAE
ncbi:MAG: M48 family metallopeptidase [Pikeienuella sp.]